MGSSCGHITVYCCRNFILQFYQAVGMPDEDHTIKRAGKPVCLLMINGS